MTVIKIGTVVITVKQRKKRLFLTSNHHEYILTNTICCYALKPNKVYTKIEINVLAPKIKMSN